MSKDKEDKTASPSTDPKTATLSGQDPLAAGTTPSSEPTPAAVQSRRGAFGFVAKNAIALTKGGKRLEIAPGQRFDASDEEMAGLTKGVDYDIERVGDTADAETRTK